MTLTATEIKWQVLDSELLAIITEAELIGTYQPPFNILLKDDKSPLYLCLTKDTYPKLLQVRKGELELQKYKATFGPYPSAYQLRQVLKLIRPIFQWCDQPGGEKSALAQCSRARRSWARKTIFCAAGHEPVAPAAIGMAGLTAARR